MPAALPPQSGYTYCVEYSVDEAEAAGATHVSFDKPLIHYVENFLDFPVGMAVPVGYYDKEKGEWLPSDNGRIVKIVSITGGMADLDTDGNDTADNGVGTADGGGDLGITDEERTRVASLYTTGQSLWRVPVTHFSPYDQNWPYGPGPRDIPPDLPGPDSNNECKAEGSIIKIQSLALGEAIDIAGTPFSLCYQSDRTPGYKQAYTLDIPLSGTSTPASLKRIELEIYGAGQHITRSFGPEPNQSYTFTWDGKDGYGRTVLWVPPVTVRVGFTYQAVYQTPASFGQSFAALSGLPIPITGSRARQEVTFWQEWERSIGTHNNLLGKKLGGWCLDIHHIYDTEGKVVYLGGGDRRSTEGFFGNIITTVAGTGAYNFSGDGGPATQAKLSYPDEVAVGPDGSLYIADTNNSRIRRVGPDGIITTVAGTGKIGFSGDGGLAALADLYNPHGVTVEPDGSLYFADYGNSRIRRVSTGGIITTVAGAGAYGISGSGYGFSGDGGLATQARVAYPSGVAVGPDGSLYFADKNNSRIRKLASNQVTKSVGKVTLQFEDDSKIYIFASNGRHLSTVSTLTGALIYQFTYDKDGLLTTIADGDGNTTTIERDTDGNATAIVGPYGQRTILDIDTNGYLKAITNPAGEVYKCSYTADGLLTEFKDPRGNVHMHTYDARGRLVKDENPAGGFTTMERTETKDGYEVTKTTAEGRVSTYLTETLSTGGRQITNSLCCGNPIQAVIGTDGSTRTTYPDGTTVYTLEGPDPRFGMQSPVITNGTVTTPAGLVKTTTGTRTVTLSDTNDPLSLQTQTDKHTVNGRSYTEVFDASTKKITTTTPMGRVVTSTIDDQGRTRKTEVPGLAATSFDYDARGRLITITTGTDTSARVTTLSYNSDGEVDTVKSPLLQDSRFEYDKAGRITRQILADAREIDFGYDANGNILSLTPPGKEPHTFSYTKVDLEESYNPPALDALSTPTLYGYNLDKQLTNINRPDGKNIQFGYNSKGKLELITLPDTKTIEYTYDDTKGQLTTITVPGGETLSFTYDGSLPLNTTWAGTVNGSVSQTYNNNFWVTSHSVNGGSPITHQYDNDGLLTGAGALTISRNAQNGMITGTTLGSVSDTRDYNAFGEVVNYLASQSALEIFSTQFVRDNLGRITEKTETVDGVTHVYNYEYDQTDRLVRVKKDGVIISEYTYDSNGNRLSHTTGSGTETASYDAQDRLSSYGSNSYTYTSNGELLTKTNATTSETASYVYDVLGNLKSASLPDGTQVEYVIDGKNRRIGKKVNGVLIQGFLYQGQLKPIVELDGNNNVISRFVYATHINVPEYMIRGGVTYRIVTDHLGSPRLVIDTATGQIVQQIDYDEFGKEA